MKKFTNPYKFRYVLYLGPDGSHGNIAEIQFFGDGRGTNTK